MLVVSLLVGVACAFAARAMAERKGRNPGTWAAIGFLFGLIGLLILVCMPSLATDVAYAADTGPMKSCPHCLARIEASAGMCDRCGRDQSRAA